MKIYTVEVTIYDPLYASEITYYFSSSNFVTKPADTPANTAFEPRVLDAGSVGIHLYSDGKTGGRSQLEIGEVVLTGTDDFFDGWQIFGADGRNVIIRYGDDTSAYPSGFKTIFYGTMDGIEYTFDSAVIRLKDKTYLLESPLITTTYGGTNSLPNGIDGTADDIKGDVKPKFFGSIFNAEPVLVNTSKLIYQINNGNFNTVSAVYVRGNAVTYSGTNRANNSAMQTTAPAAGTYDTCSSEGLIRLGTAPDGLVTMDVYRGATAANRTTAQIMSTIASNMGITAYAADVTALDAINSNVIGLYVNDTRSASDALDEVAQSIGAYYYFDHVGQFRMGQLTDPYVKSPVDYLYDYDMIDIKRVNSRDINIPAYRIVYNYLLNETVQTTDIAGAVTAARKSWLARKYRTVISEDTAVLTWYLTSKPYQVNSRLTVASEAATEAARLLALHSAGNCIIEVTIDIDRFNYNLMDTISVTYNKLGLAGGPSFSLIGYTLSSSDNTAILSLWGRS
ncbi:MAG: hypothetical protein M0R47_15820 [Methylobacter sp.]|uniref:hypothetical protein n=1 Tax=Methylobacter sp. TaxID=2051955 RepID=UPI0025D24196|nr:hypothetical protein [Methylobacter sp.]MCK9621988.1 hypothetical protein [Methylobacter sp.]